MTKFLAAEGAKVVVSDSADPAALSESVAAVRGSGAEVVFGPAPRPLPQLQVYVDGAGFLRAAGDFDEPIGPGFWNRGSGP